MSAYKCLNSGNTQLSSKLIHMVSELASTAAITHYGAMRALSQKTTTFCVPVCLCVRWTDSIVQDCKWDSSSSRVYSCVCEVDGL
jgi:hypothetical protein